MSSSSTSCAPRSNNPATPSAFDPSSIPHSQPLAAGALPTAGFVNAETAPLVHETRTSNLTDAVHYKNKKLNLPPSGDTKVWKDLDRELSDALPQVFTRNVFNMYTTTHLSKKLDSYLYKFFEEKCGLLPVKDKSDSQSIPQKPFRHRGLERLRVQKNELRKALRTLRNAGQSQTKAFSCLQLKWRRLIRKHNNLRKAVKLKSDKRAKLRAEAQFKKDPHRFAANLFTDSKSAAPTFSKEQATNYFANTYRDEQRDQEYEPLQGLPKPSLPTALFSLRCPSPKEIKRSVLPKSNKATPGLNALPYTVYKKCPSIIKTLHKIFKKVWHTKDVPEDWAVAFIVLLSKDPDKRDAPSEFRPIAITNTVGKIFFSIVSSRLQSFFVKNDFIRRTVQKGFLSGVAGCVEHSFTLFEALREAKDEQRQIVVAWIDLANAYGSVRHNLIQFAMNWYHVPRHVQELVFDYYNKLMATVETKEWSTGFFLFDIGLFQGCVLSTILFDCVFQLLLDFLNPLEAFGYKFKATDSQRLTRAYADDLALTARDSNKLQIACDYTDKFLSWTKTMKAKPRKCIAVGYRQFDPRNKPSAKNSSFRPSFDTVYSAFDPQVSIANTQMVYLLNPVINQDKLTHDHFKFLGRWININLSEEKIKDHVRREFLKEVRLVDGLPINGLMKLWLYQHYLLAHLSWPLMIHDFARSFAVKLTESVNSKLKKWAGLYRSADLGSLFRPKSLPGSLGLSSVTSHFEKMQVIKCSILQDSQDPDVKRVYEAKSKRTSKWTAKWSATKTTDQLTAEATMSKLFPAQETRQGLGSGNFKANPTSKEFRGLITAAAKKKELEESLSHSAALCHQGRWTTWYEKTVPFDLSWNNLIHADPYLIKFVLNATINGCVTPSMRKMWGYKTTDKCPICNSNESCTLHHILSGCKTALNQGRFTWRHDSVLQLIQNVVSKAVATHNNTHRPGVHSALSGLIFVKQGTKPVPSRKRPSTARLLEGATDWKCLVDLGRSKLVFPPDIYCTSERPDLVIWSKKLHKVLLVELTVPAEENIEAAQLRKEARYLPLCEAINSDTCNPWKASLTTIEVGTRGNVAHTTRSFLRKMGLTNANTNAASKDISLIAARCSYAIYLSRDNEAWSKPDLISVYAKPDPPEPSGGSGFQAQWKHRQTCLSFYSRPCTCTPSTVPA